MEEGIKEMIERWKVKAEIFLKNNTKAFIVDVFDNFHWCIILSFNDDAIIIKNFKGSRKYEEERIFWCDIRKFEEYKDREGWG